MYKKFFLLTEGDDTVIGVIGCSNNDELNTKANIALNSHFDTEIESSINLDMELYLYGKQGEFQVNIPFANDPEYIANIFIQSVDIY